MQAYKKSYNKLRVVMNRSFLKLQINSINFKS